MRIFHPLRSRSTALLWAGLATSAIGDQVYIVAIAWIGVAAFGPRAGWLNALGAACTLLTVLFAGPWVDRFRPASAMVAADGTRALALLAVVAAWGAGSPLPVWATLLALAVAVLGVGQGVFRPALQHVMPATVADPALLPAANALFDSTERIARLIGPGAIGVLAAALSPVWFLLVDAATFVVSLACIRRVAPGLLLAAPHEPPSRRPLRAALLHGYRVTLRHPVLGWHLLTGTQLNATWVATYYLALPLMVEQHRLGLGSGSEASAGFGAYGLVLLGYGCVNLLANLVVGSRDVSPVPMRTLALAYSLSGAGALALGLCDILPLDPSVRLLCYVACAALASVAGPLQDVTVATLRQTDLPRSDVPAAVRAYMAATQGGMMVALLAAPVVLSAMSPGAFVLGCGALNTATSLATLLRGRRTRVAA